MIEVARGCVVKATIRTVVRATCGNYSGERRPRGGWKVLERSGGNCFEVKFNNEAEVAFRLLCHWKLVSNR